MEIDLSFGVQNEAVKKAYYESIEVKSAAWIYENEYRLLTKPANCEPQIVKKCHSISTLEHFLEFKREWVKSVDFGIRCPDAEIQRVIDLLKADYSNVIYRKAKFHKTEYALEYERI
jgi:hypothetical protein